MKNEAGVSLDEEGNPRTICPVTLSALALANQDTLDRVLAEPETFPKAMNGMLTITIGETCSHPAALPLWRSLGSIEFRVWESRRINCAITIEIPNRTPLHWNQRTFIELPAMLPETAIASLPGRPVAALLAHPLFAGLSFEADAVGDPVTPAETIQVDGGLLIRIAARRAAMLAAFAAANPAATG